MGKNIEKILRGFLIFGAGYFIFDALLHLSNIKLLSPEGVWPASAISYAHLLNYIYASFVILASLVAIVIQQDLKKYKTIVTASGIWTFFHGIVLLYLVWSKNLAEIFKDLPSLQIWLPFYGQYLIFNAILLFIFSAVTYLWVKGNNGKY